MPLHAEELRRFLAEATGRPVTLRLNDNQHTLITARPERPGRGIRVSIHRIFLNSSREVLDALARFIVAPKPNDRKTIRFYINENANRLSRVVPTRPPKARTVGSARGDHYDLQTRADRLNERYFNNELKFQIIWGRRIRSGRNQRHATLGTWNRRARTIRIHPMLDHPRVPWYFLDYIIYHEMVHIAVPSKACGDRMAHHTNEFYAMERAYPFYRRAVAWETRWLPKLILQWNGGRQLPAEAAG